MFDYLTTDGQVLGIVAWVSGVLTVFGIGIAIFQSTGAKGAAKEAKFAAETMVNTVQSRESLIELIDSRAHAASAQDALGRKNLEAGHIYVNLFRGKLVQACELVADDRNDQKTVRNLVARAGDMSEKLLMLDGLPPEKRDLMPLILELSKLARTLDDIIARRRRRYAYEAIRGNQ